MSTPLLPPEFSRSKKSPWHFAGVVCLGALVCNLEGRVTGCGGSSCAPSVGYMAATLQTTAPSATPASEKLPAWIPVYPGWTITSDGGLHMKSGEDETGSVAGTTKDEVAKVSSYYKDALEKAGFKCEETNAKVGAVEMSSVTAKHESLGQELTVSVQKDSAQPQAQVTLVYQSKKP